MNFFQTLLTDSWEFTSLEVIFCEIAPQPVSAKAEAAMRAMTASFFVFCMMKFPSDETKILRQSSISYVWINEN